MFYLFFLVLPSLLLYELFVNQEVILLNSLRTLHERLLFLLIASDFLLDLLVGERPHLDVLLQVPLAVTDAVFDPFLQDLDVALMVSVRRRQSNFFAGLDSQTLDYLLLRLDFLRQLFFAFLSLRQQLQIVILFLVVVFRLLILHEGGFKSQRFIIIIVFEFFILVVDLLQESFRDQEPFFQLFLIEGVHVISQLVALLREERGLSLALERLVCLFDVREPSVLEPVRLPEFRPSYSAHFA